MCCPLCTHFRSCVSTSSAVWLGLNDTIKPFFHACRHGQGHHCPCPNPVVLNIILDHGGLLDSQGEPASRPCQYYSPSRAHSDLILACSQVPILTRSYFQTKFDRSSTDPRMG